MSNNVVKVYFGDDSGFSIDENSSLSPDSAGNELCGGILGSDQNELQEFMGSVTSVLCDPNVASGAPAPSIPEYIGTLAPCTNRCPVYSTTSVLND